MSILITKGAKIEHMNIKKKKITNNNKYKDGTNNTLFKKQPIHFLCINLVDVLANKWRISYCIRMLKLLHKVI